MERAHVIITGRVQGVFFRDHTLAKANSLDISGWVKNRDDGKVEAVFEGRGEKIDEILEWCMEGSPEAQVKHIDVEWEDPKGEKEFIVMS